ncbi:conserved Plasmodium protein, unknown function [Plasmodium berghei]|nr:conserved Plasmodium protein, unknown function [Plasmodium berghei]
MMAELTASAYGAATRGSGQGLIPFKSDIFSLFVDPRFLQGVIFGIILFYLIMYYNSRKRMNKKHNSHE